MLKQSSFASNSCLMILCAAALTLFAACTGEAPTRDWHPTDTPLLSFTSDHFLTVKDHPSCKATLDEYCNYLYSPDALGNIEIKRAHKSIKILQGETKNGFSQVFYRYSIAKIEHQNEFPKDFFRILKRHNYFDKLDSLLTRQPRVEMNMQQRLSVEQLNFELGFIWGAAFNETIVQRMTQKYAGFYKIPERLIPIELDLERRRIRRVLISEVSQAIWKNDKNWHKVEDQFARLQKSFLEVISNLDIPENIRTDWTTRIQQVKLVLPGSTPEISDEECSTTNINAYYYYHLNLLTVCAGDFNSEDIMQTLAHEMGHALGLNRTQYLYEVNSEIGKSLADFRKKICQPKTFSCDDWTTFKNKFSSNLDGLASFKPELPEFQRCLKRQVTKNVLADKDYVRFAKVIVADRMSELASNNRFLRITKEQIPFRNGKLQSNPNYLDPCSYYLWSQGEEPIDDELTTLMFFTAEYRCSKAENIQKLKGSLETAKNMTEQVVEKSLRIEGEFSSHDQLELEGFSSPPYERFADVLGSYAMGNLLQTLPDKSDRMNVFLGSSSWQCLEPSIDSRYPEESSVEHEYIFDEHTEGDIRKKEWFSLPIRNAIGCEKDFEFKECSLGFKSGKMKMLTP